MSASTLKDKSGTPGSKITFELELAPALRLEDMEMFHRVAAGQGRTVEELIVELIREELAEAAAA